MQGIGKTSAEVRQNTDTMSENVGEKTVIDGDMKSIILNIITENSKISATGIANAMSVTSRTVERYIKELREENRLIRRGPARGGYWEVKK